MISPELGECSLPATNRLFPSMSCLSASSAETVAGSADQAGVQTIKIAVMRRADAVNFAFKRLIAFMVSFFPALVFGSRFLDVLVIGFIQERGQAVCACCAIKLRLHHGCPGGTSLKDCTRQLGDYGGARNGLLRREALRRPGKGVAARLPRPMRAKKDHGRPIHRL